MHIPLNYLLSQATHREINEKSLHRIMHTSKAQVINLPGKKTDIKIVSRVWIKLSVSFSPWPLQMSHSVSINITHICVRKKNLTWADLFNHIFNLGFANLYAAPSVQVKTFKTGAFDTHIQTHTHNHSTWSKVSLIAQWQTYLEHAWRCFLSSEISHLFPKTTCQVNLPFCFTHET